MKKHCGGKVMKDFIVWFVFEGEDDYMVISAGSLEEALDSFGKSYGLEVTDCHEIDYENQEYVA